MPKAAPPLEMHD